MPRTAGSGCFAPLVSFALSLLYLTHLLIAPINHRAFLGLFIPSLVQVQS